MKEPRDILVIDDEPVVTQGVVKICGAEGWTVDTADSAEAGLARLAERAHRLILCDIMMEGCDGFQFLAQARGRSIRTPIIMTTGYSTVGHAVRSLREGALDFLAKPFTMDELLAVVHRGLAYGRLREEGEPEAACPQSLHRLGLISWASTEAEGIARIGLSAPFVHMVGEIRGLHLSPPDAELVQGLRCAVIDAADGLPHDVLCPISGRILETNPRLAADPALAGREPYGEGWLYRIVPTDLAYDLKSLETDAAPLNKGDLT